MKVFNGPAEFVDYLEENPELREVIAWTDDLIRFHKNVHKGCKCKERLRMLYRDDSYRQLVSSVIENDLHLRSFLRDYLGEEEIEFKLNGEVLLEIT